MSKTVIGIVEASSLETLHNQILDRITELQHTDPRYEVVSVSHAADPDYDPALWTALITCRKTQ